MRMLLTGVVLVTGCLLLSPGRASGWGKEAHEVTGKIANAHLKSKARRAINDLLAGHEFRSIGDGRLSNWADSIRGSSFFRQKYPNAPKWHFIDVDVNADLATLDLSTFCPNGDCALGAIKKFRGKLNDPQETLQNRREALFFIVHFVEDIHQPLHCAERNDDRGGNLVRVRMPHDNHVTNLHKVWDTEIVQDAMDPLTTTDYAAKLINTITPDIKAKHQAGKLEDWILDSHKLARTVVYDIGKPDKHGVHRLTDDYVDKATEVIEEQLIKGGLRLAKFLNDAFKE